MEWLISIATWLAIAYFVLSIFALFVIIFIGRKLFMNYKKYQRMEYENNKRLRGKR